jgi:hypothetical protein
MKQSSCLRCGEQLPPVADAFCPSCHEPLDSASDEVAEIFIRPRTLAILLKYKESPPTVGWCLLRSTPIYLLLATLFGTAACLFIFAGAETLAIAVVGALAGILVRDFGWFVRICRTWPEQAALMDWERIEALARVEMAAENSKSSAASDNYPSSPSTSRR